VWRFRAASQRKVALEACRCGFEALPADLLRAGVDYGAAKAKSEVKAYVKEKTGVDIPTSGKELVSKGKKLALSEAKNLAAEELRKMGVPNIPVDISLITNPTPEKVKDAAYAVGKVYAEKAIAAKTGIPIKLPDKLTVKALGDMVGSVFPTNVEELLNTALTVGAQLAASALTSLLAGTAIGSVIPGLGTVVGLAVGLAIAGIKSLFAKDPPPQSQNCKTKLRGVCPKPPANINGFQGFAWASKELKPVWDALRREQDKSPCGKGKALDCARGLDHVRDVTFWMSLNTVGQLGLPLIARMTSEVSKAPEIEGGISFMASGSEMRPITDFILHRNQSLSSPKELAELLRRYRLGSSAITRGTSFLPGETRNEWGGRRPLDFGDYVSSKLLIQALRWRKAELEKLLRDANATLNDPHPSGNFAPALRQTLMGEFASAAVQIQNNPTQDAISWFKTLWGFVQRLEVKQAEATRNDALRAKRGYEVAKGKIEKDPTGALQAQIRTARALCSGGSAAACAELKVLETRTTPAPLPKAPYVPPKEVAKAIVKTPYGVPPKVVEAAKREVKRVERETKPVPGQPGIVRQRGGFDVKAFRRKAEQILEKARAEVQSGKDASADLVTSVLNVQPRISFPVGSLSGSLVPYLRNF
jgi:hypothetical protein